MAHKLCRCLAGSHLDFSRVSIVTLAAPFRTAERMASQAKAPPPMTTTFCTGADALMAGRKSCYSPVPCLGQSYSTLTRSMCFQFRGCVEKHLAIDILIADCAVNAIHAASHCEHSREGCVYSQAPLLQAHVSSSMALVPLCNGNAGAGGHVEHRCYARSEIGRPLHCLLQDVIPAHKTGLCDA